MGSRTRSRDKNGDREAKRHGQNPTLVDLARINIGRRLEPLRPITASRQRLPAIDSDDSSLGPKAVPGPKLKNSSVDAGTSEVSVEESNRLNEEPSLLSIVDSTVASIRGLGAETRSRENNG